MIFLNFIVTLDEVNPDRSIRFLFLSAGIIFLSTMSSFFIADVDARQQDLDYRMQKSFIRVAQSARESLYSNSRDNLLKVASSEDSDQFEKTQPLNIDSSSIVDVISALPNSEEVICRGFVIGSKGFVVTAYHLLQAHKVTAVRLQSEAVYPVQKVVYVDLDLDLCIVKINAKDLPQAVVTDSSFAYIGQPVFSFASSSAAAPELSQHQLSQIKYFNNKKWLTFKNDAQSSVPGDILFNAKGEAIGLVTYVREDGYSVACVLAQIKNILDDPAGVTSMYVEDDMTSKINYYLLEGYRYSMLGFFDQALYAYTKILDLNPRSANAYNNIGNTHQALGNYQDALDNYKRALKIDPNIAEVYFNMGNTYMALNQNMQAVNMYEKAIQLNGGLVEAYYNLANIYYALRDYGQSAVLYEKAVSIDPFFPGIFFNIGNVYSALGDFAKAVTSYEREVKVNPGNAGAFTNLGLSYYSLKLYADAKKSFLKAQELYGHEKNYLNVKKIDTYLKKIPGAAQE